LVSFGECESFECPPRPLQITKHKPFNRFPEFLSVSDPSPPVGIPLWWRRCHAILLLKYIYEFFNIFSHMTLSPASFPIYILDLGEEEESIEGGERVKAKQLCTRLTLVCTR
jgi:hypothetical protein